VLALLLHEDAAHAVLQAAALHDVLHSRVSLRDVLHSRVSLRDVLHSRVSLRDVLHSWVSLRDVLHSRVSLRDVLHSRVSLRDVLHSRVFAALHDVLHMPHQARRGQEEVVGEVVGDLAWPPSEP